MSTKYEGTLEKIFEKAITTRRGKKNVYSLKIDGNDNWFDCGFEKPAVEEGKYVQFEAERNDKGYWKVDKSGVIEIERPKSATVSTSEDGGGTGQPQTSYEKEIRYNYRFAFGVSQEYALACLEKGFLPTNGGTTKAKKAATLEDLDQFIEERAVKVFAKCWDIEGLEAMLDGMEGVDAEEVAPGPEEESGSED